MTGDVQHCPSCETEYRAGIETCADCGAALRPGPPPRYAPAGAPAPAAALPEGEPGRLLARLPGLQADHAVRALVLEGIACHVECEGLRKTYEPGTPPGEPFAITLPVEIYVADARLDEAQDILRSLEDDDVIGEQWSKEAAATEAPPAEVLPVESPVEEPAATPTAASDGMTWRIVAVIAVAVFLLLFLLRR